jgi:hypothetical protein
LVAKTTTYLERVRLRELEIASAGNFLIMKFILNLMCGHQNNNIERIKELEIASAGNFLIMKFIKDI